MRTWIGCRIFSKSEETSESSVAQQIQELALVSKSVKDFSTEEKVDTDKLCEWE